MTPEEIHQSLISLQPLRDELRSRAMIYQVEEKEFAATRQGLSPTTYHHLPYAEWAEVRARWGYNAKA